MGDAGERGPPGPDGNEVRTCSVCPILTSVFCLRTLASSVCAVSLEAAQVDSVS